MKKGTLFFLTLLTSLYPLFSYGQCNTSDATFCLCSDSLSQDCDLLPDIRLSADAIDFYGGYQEYPQTGAKENYPGQGSDNGRLRLNIVIANIGSGPLQTIGTNSYLCGNNPVQDPGDCQDTTVLKRLVDQRIYHKSGTIMTYEDRAAHYMEFHPTHKHMHISNWVNVTIREEDALENDPRKWPVIGESNKVGFCFRDDANCSDLPGFCRDTMGNTLVNDDINNFMLGGGEYKCNPPDTQGISAGFIDIYDLKLADNWVNIPPGICNGEYFVVAEVDPLNAFIEENETNNWIAVPIELRKQIGKAQISVSTNGLGFCDNEVALLTASQGDSFEWSTGETSQSIVASSGGDYWVKITSNCGISLSDTLKLDKADLPSAPMVSSDTICAADTVILSAIADGLISWYSHQLSDNPLAVGNNFQAVADTTTTYYVSNTVSNPGKSYSLGPNDTLSGFYSDDEYLLAFDCISPFTLKSITVYTKTGLNRVVELRDHLFNIVKDTLVHIPAGKSKVTLNFNVEKGYDYTLQIIGLKEMYVDTTPSYPYIIPNVVSIHSAYLKGHNQAVYPYFLDWEIITGPTTCESERVPVTVQVDNCSSLDEQLWPFTNLEIFPNPSDGLISYSISSSSSEELRIILYDLLGNTVYQEKIGNSGGVHSGKMDLSTLAKGIYVIRIHNSERQVLRTGKVLLY